MLQFKLIFILFSNEEIKTPWYIKEINLIVYKHIMNHM